MNNNDSNTPSDSDSPWEDAMAAGFGPASSDWSVDGPESVLRWLAERKGLRSRIILRAPGTVPGENTVQPSPPPGSGDPLLAGKYVVAGELARGGVGVVRVGIDQDLGRDVALKFLRDEYCQNIAVLQRFLEEAQVGGQLQHPGIVPVYDFGLEGDRPFFAMKLVQGKTLAELLADRDSVDAERHRFLQIFEQVCQTVAYAHARGVIHRDLKPANVMVGAFGEVQVVDWGMAKVLRHGGAGGAGEAGEAGEASEVGESGEAGRPPVADAVRTRPRREGTDSVAGSVLGTPEYMPPEQAVGDVERMDERSDVFALGAVLCEILTGEPPYVAAEGDPLMQAVDARLQHAVSRLEACDTERELVDLALECLRADLRARPPDAKAVADRAAAYLASVQERAQRAVVVAAEERVRAVAAKRSQRLTLALAASVVAILSLGGGGYLWVRTDAERRVEAAIADVRILQGRATSAAIGDLSTWNEARTALKHVHSLASGFTDLVARVDRLERDLQAGHDAAVERAGRHAKNERMRARLAEIAYPPDDGLSIGLESLKKNLRKRFEAYDRAFAQYGIDVHADVENVADAMRSSPLAVELAVSLDVGAMDLRYLGRHAEAQRRVRIARRADGDRWRGRFRDAAFASPVDRDALQEMIRDANAKDLPEPNIFLLSRVAASHGLEEEAAELLTKAWRQRPSNDHLAHMLGRIERSLGHPNLARAYLTVALSHRPDSPTIWFDLGAVARAAGDRGAAEHHNRQALRLEPDNAAIWTNLGNTSSDRDEAIRHYEEALRLDPDYALAWYNLGNARQGKGQLDEAVHAYREAIRLEPKLAPARFALGNQLARMGDWDEAIRLYGEALDLGLQTAPLHDALAYAHARKGNLDKAVASSREAVRLEPGTAKWWRHLGLRLLTKGDVDEAVRAYRKAIHCEPGSAAAWAGLGRALGLRGRPHEALLHLREAIRLQPASAEAWYYLGAFLEKQGKIDEAVRHLREAIRLQPARAETQYYLGMVLDRQGKVEEAIRHLREAIRLRPSFAEPWWYLGTVLSRQKEVDEAVRHLREAIRLRPAYAEAWFYLGTVFSRRGEVDEAMRHHREVIRLQPEHGRAWFELGAHLAQNGDIDEALDAYRKACQHAPSLAKAWLNRGGLLVGKAELDEAERCLREASRLDPKSWRAWANLGLVLSQSGKLDEAARAYREVTRIAPTFAPAHYYLVASLRRKGALDEALESAREAIQRLPRDARAWLECGITLRMRGDVESAARHCREAVRLDPRLARAWCELGLALQRQGLLTESVEPFRKGHELGSKQHGWTHPSEQLLDTAKAQAARETRWLAIVHGEADAADADESVEAGVLALRRKMPARAVELVRSAIESKTELLEEHRYKAASAAASAGCGLGSDTANLTPSAKTELRKQALTWLQPMLAAFEKQADRGAATALRWWCWDPNLAGIRGEAALHALPPGEREAWTAFWSRVRAVRRELEKK